MYLETITYKGKDIKIYIDEDSENPREWDNLGTMACFHKRYQLGDKHDWQPDEFADWLEKEENAGKLIALPLYLYDHSGVAMSTRSFIGRAHHAEWDSGLVGYIFVTKETIREEFLNCKRVTKKRLDQAYKCLQAEVDIYDQYLRGEVFGYQIDLDCEVDSCWGYYDKDYMVREAQSVIDYYEENSPIRL